MSSPADRLGPDAIVALSPIGYVQTRYQSPEQAPPQATMAYREQGQVVIFERFAAGLTGLRVGQYIWLLTWLHSQTDEQTTPLMVVPRGWEGTGRTTGVYATRTPNRHNRIALSLVRIREVVGNVLHFAGVDLVDGTPVLDIKPWSETSDSQPWSETSDSQPGSETSDTTSSGPVVDPA